MLMSSVSPLSRGFAPSSGTEAKSKSQSYLEKVADTVGFTPDARHRYLIVQHLFDDTQRMLDALDTRVEFDAILGIPYSSNRTGVRERWTKRFGDKVHITPHLDALEARLVRELATSLAACRRNGQRLIVQDVGGFVVPILHTYFADQLPLVKGVVEITKQGVWRAEEIDLAFPVLHCADSELKRLEAKRCGETIALCLDRVARRLGQSLAGRTATVFGAGWIGTGVATALRRLDMVTELVDPDPLKVAEARLNGFSAGFEPRRLGESHLAVGATGRRSITRDVLDHLPSGAIVASGSSRQLEIDMEYLSAHPARAACEAVDAIDLATTGRPRSLLLVNDGYPANFIPGSESVPDEIVETILAELIVLIGALAAQDFEPGIHRITPEQEAHCARLWLQMRDSHLATPPANEAAAKPAASLAIVNSRSAPNEL